MQKTSFGIKTYKSSFNFSAAHFLLFGKDSRESLHGHNYIIKVSGKSYQLDDNQLVFDFLSLAPIIEKVVKPLDHTTIIADKSPFLQISRVDQNISITTSQDETFVIPAKDVTLLPIENSTAEKLAEYIAQRVLELLKTEHNFSFSLLEVEVEEETGFSATYTVEEDSL